MKKKECGVNVDSPSEPEGPSAVATGLQHSPMPETSHDYGPPSPLLSHGATADGHTVNHHQSVRPKTTNRSIRFANAPLQSHTQDHQTSWNPKDSGAGSHPTNPQLYHLILITVVLQLIGTHHQALEPQCRYPHYALTTALVRDQVTRPTGQITACPV